jgi:hypothetical protein
MHHGDIYIMNILLIAYYFAPAYSIAAVRPSKLCKYWTRKGHQVTVLTSTYDEVANNQDKTLLSEELEHCRIIRVNYFSLIRLLCKFTGYHVFVESGAKNKTDGSIAKKIYEMPFLGIVRKIRHSINEDNFTWYWNSRRALRKLAQTEDEFDFIFSTCGPIASHQIGRYAKRLFPGTVWIADFRDQYDQLSTVVTSWKKKQFKRIIWKISQAADAFSFVSSGLTEAFRNEAGGIEKFIITNGFDRDDFATDVTPLKKEGGERSFNIVYTGHLYGYKRDFSALFRVLRDLENDKLIDVCNVHVVYAGTHGALVKQMAAQYDLEANVVDLGLLMRKDSLALQKSADVLLLTTWNYKNEQGIVTAKIYEYMMQESPIIALVNGDLAGSAVADIIRKCRLGVVWEQANDAEDYPRLKDAFLKMYLDCMSGRKIDVDPDRKEISIYSYDSIASEFIDLANGLLG